MNVPIKLGAAIRMSLGRRSAPDFFDPVLIDAYNLERSDDLLREAVDVVKRA